MRCTSAGVMSWSRVSLPSRPSMRSSSVRPRFMLRCRLRLTADGLALSEKTIHDEEVSNVDIAESMAELKVSSDRPFDFLRRLTLLFRTSLRPSTPPSATPMPARSRISSNSSRSALAKSAPSMRPSIASRVSTRNLRSAPCLVWTSYTDRHCSVPSPLLRQALRAARTSLRALKT